MNLKKFNFEFYEERTKIIRYIHYLKTSLDFHRIIIFAKKSYLIFIKHYFDKKENNFKTDLPQGNPKTNSQPHKRAKESVKIAI